MDFNFKWFHIKKIKHTNLGLYSLRIIHSFILVCRVSLSTVDGDISLNWKRLWTEQIIAYMSLLRKDWIEIFYTEMWIFLFLFDLFLYSICKGQKMIVFTARSRFFFLLRAQCQNIWTLFSLIRVAIKIAVINLWLGQTPMHLYLVLFYW